ncbi:MAG: DMT family transporter, partial [Longimicrobiales bacterium]
IKVALTGISPVMQAGIRSVLAVVLLWAWMRARAVPVLVDDGAWKPGLAAGLLFSVEFCMIYWGLEYTTASHLIVFLYMAPFVVALGVHFLLPSERLSLVQIAGMTIAFGGVVLIFSEGLFAPPMETAWIGDVMAFLAALFWGLTTLLVRLSRLCTIAPARTLFYQLAVSAFLLPIASVLIGEPGIIEITPIVAACVVFQAIIVAFASYLAWFWLIAHYPVPLLSSYTFLAPLFGVIFGVLLLSEPMTVALAGGAGLSGAGIYLVNRKRPMPAARWMPGTASES